MRRTIKINNEVLKKMKMIYYTKDSEYLDWMGYKITEENKPSFHHIEKAEELRKKKENDDASIENGAYLGKKSHELLHRIEVNDKELYDSWNNLFSLINKLGHYPDENIWNMIFTLKDKSKEYEEKDNKNLKRDIM